MLPGQVGYSGHALSRSQRVQLQEVLGRTVLSVAYAGGYGGAWRPDLRKPGSTAFFCEIWPAGYRMAAMALKISLVWRRVLGARDFDRKTSRLIPRWDFFASDEPSWGIHVFFSIPDLCGEIFLSPCKKRCFLKMTCCIDPFISFLTT